MNRIDYRQVFREVYAPPRQAVVRITVPPRRCLAVDGEGSLSSSAFTEAVAAVRSLARAIRRRIQRGPMALEFRLMPLEVQWHDPQRWTVLVFQPPVLDAALVAAEQATLAAGAAARIEFRHLPEAQALQTLHAGGLNTLPDALDRLQAFATTHGLRLTDGHLAIDLGDPRKPPFSCDKMLVRRELLGNE